MQAFARLLLQPLHNLHKTIMKNITNTINMLIILSSSANIDTEDAGIAPGSFGTKVISDKNIWDDEW